MEVKFCERNFVSSSTMRVIFDIRTKLLQELRALKFIQSRGGGGDMRDLNVNSERWPMVKGALCAGLYPNLLRVDRSSGEAIQPREGKIRFHSSSILYHPPASTDGNGNTIDNAHQRTVTALPTDWLLYERVGKSSRRHATIKCCTAVSAITVGLFAGNTRQLSLQVSEQVLGTPAGHAAGSSTSSMMMPFEVVKDAEMGPCSHGFKLKIDDWISFSMDYDDLYLLHCLRVKFHALVMRRMRQPGKGWTTLDQNVLTSVERLLCNEEDSTGLMQPSGIGQRPRQMQMDFVSPRCQQRLLPPVASVQQNGPFGSRQDLAPAHQPPPPTPQQHSFHSLPIFNGQALIPPNLSVAPPVDSKPSMSGSGPSLAYDFGGAGDAPPFYPHATLSRSSSVMDVSSRHGSSSIFASGATASHLSSMVSSRPPPSSASKFMMMAHSSSSSTVASSSSRDHLKLSTHSKSFGGHHGGSSGHHQYNYHHLQGGNHGLSRHASFEGLNQSKEATVAFFVVKPRSSEVYDYAVAKGMCNGA